MVKLGGLLLGLLASGALEEAGAGVAIIQKANSGVVNTEVVVPQVWVPSFRGIPGLLLPS